MELSVFTGPNYLNNLGLHRKKPTHDHQSTKFGRVPPVTKVMGNFEENPGNLPQERDFKQIAPKQFFPCKAFCSFIGSTKEAPHFPAVALNS